jgi:hypothetical protein
MSRRPALTLGSLLAALWLAGCAGGYRIDLKRSVHRARYEGYSYHQLYEAAHDALFDLGVVERADRDKGLIAGQIPPYRVKAVLDQEQPVLLLEAVELDRGQWKRDHLKRHWVLDQDGMLHIRQGVKTLPDAVAAWGREVERLLHGRPTNVKRAGNDAR